VPTQGADMAALIKSLISSGVKPSTVKALDYMTLVPITKDTANIPSTCWNLSDYKK
jgi:ribose transport system substrate-binding protein